jgi:hypothetical protein
MWEGVCLSRGGVRVSRPFKKAKRQCCGGMTWKVATVANLRVSLRLL